MNRPIPLLFTAAGLVFFGSALAQPADEPATRPTTRPSTRPATQPAMQDSMQGGMEDSMTGGRMEGSMEGSVEDAMRARSARERAAATTQTERSIFLRRLSRPQGAAVGTMLPTDLTLYALNGRERPLSTLLARNRSTVIVLGSLSSPSFRDRLPDIPWLVPQLGGSELLIVYTREQHPAGSEWEVPRNEAENVHIPVHKSLEERIEQAMRVHEAQGLRGRVVVDAMDDALLKAIVSEEAIDRPHNTAVIVSPEGNVLARQDWFDPSGIPSLLEGLEGE